MRNYSVLLVDDESFVVDWIYELLDIHLGSSLSIYKAYTTQRALEIAGSTKIDLLITDINMPEINGLAMVDRIAAIWPMCKSVLLTGHPSFDYAQEAIRKGISSYVLKTSGDKEILSEVQQALKLVDEEIERQQSLIDMQQNLEDQQNQLRRQAFFTWIRGNYLSMDELDQCKRILNVNNMTHDFYLIVGSIAKPEGSNNKDIFSSSVAAFRLKSIVNHYLQPYTDLIIAEVANDRVIWLIEPQARSDEDFKETQIIGALEIAQQAASQSLGIDVSFVVSERVKHEITIPEQYLLIKAKLDSPMPADGLIYLGEKHDERNSTDNTLTKNENNSQSSSRDGLISSAETIVMHRQNTAASLRRFLDQGNQTDFNSLFNSYCDNLAKSINWHSSQTLENYYNLLSSFLSYINQNQLETNTEIKNLVFNLSRPANAPSFELLRSEMTRLANILFEERENQRHKNISDVLETIQEYISNNIENEISLLDLSELTGYSTNYLSRFFSKTTGITIGDYIAKKKIARIQELMRNSNLNISEIASKTGFQSRTYFNSYFKRYVGMAPQQYRDSIENS